MASSASPIDALDWRALERALDETGWVATQPVIAAADCGALAALWRDERAFRSRVEMARHRYGSGEYRYFAYPLPPLVQALRAALYPRLAPIANRWAERLRETRRYPRSLRAFLAQCHAAAQKRPTPLLLRYTAGGYNCLHQDRYGDVGFPLQVAVFLSRPRVDYDGGAFLLVEQRPRSQSRGEALTPERGGLVIFPNVAHPLATRRGFARAPVRHGVATITRGERLVLGLIFHDAR